MAIFKVFAKKADRKSILENTKLIESYDSFVVVETSQAAAKTLARTFPVEDISDQYQVPFAGRELDPLAKTARAKRPSSRSRVRERVGAGPHHYIVQFVGPIKPAWLTALRRAGTTVREPFGGFAYVVRGDEAALGKLKALKYVRWIGHLPWADRVAPSLDNEARASRTLLPRRRVIPDTLTVEVIGTEDVPRVASAARKLGFKLLHADRKARLITLDCSGFAKVKSDKIRLLSAVHGVRFIRERVIPRTSNNVATREMDNGYAALNPNGLKLAGKGEIIAVCDTGLDSGNASSIHPDLAGRVKAIKSYPITPDWNSFITNPGGDDGPADLDSGHGTHVAGSVLANGTASATGPVLIRGHAYKAKLVFQAVEQEMKWKPNAPAKLRRERFVLAGIPSDLTSLFQYAYVRGARVHSNSWGGGDPGDYDNQCEQFDAFVWRHKDFCFVIAAGNDGSDADGDGRINATSVTSPGTAKNCITVGACENLRPEFNDEKYGGWWPDDYPVAPYKSDPMANNPKQVVAFSSRGPTNDGRVKPEVIAPGTFILSTRSTRIAPNNFAWAAYPPNKMYFHMGGTSMATPLTSGAVALIREFLRKERGIANPSAAMLKALLVAGAQRLPASSKREVVDNDQGFGRVNLDRSLKSVLQTTEGAGLHTGQLSTSSLSVARAGRTLRVVLAYTDYPGKRLVNNLNLIVTDPSGKRYIGNQRTTTAMNLSMDSRNNVELIQVAKAKKGKWTVNVLASNVAKGPQDFALAAVTV